VRRLHVNASGEGKRSDMDGHNMDIKSRRESAMRAGEPAACVARVQRHRQSFIAVVFNLHLADASSSAPAALAVFGASSM
jgi:hypothetical protein